MKNAGFSDVLIGLQYGDEGKAKLIDALASSYDVVARFNGGVNAGHTVVTDLGTLALRQVPSAVSYPQCELYIGSGCVVSLAELVEEIAKINQTGIDITDRFKISTDATIVLPHHVILDRMHGGEVGTTGNGIGPAYADRAQRYHNGEISNIKFGTAVSNPAEVVRISNYHLALLKDQCDEDLYALGKRLLGDLRISLDRLAPYKAPSSTYLAERVSRGASVLFEGAQSYMLDVSKGDIPYVTSSYTGVGAAYTGGDVPPIFHRTAFGIVKLVMSRVGRGPFPSEFGGEKSHAYCTQDGGRTHTRSYEKENLNPDELMSSGDPFSIGQALRIYSGEYGTGSGRPRRIGMLDLAQLSSAVLANGIQSLVLTKCDCLRDFSKTPDRQIPVVMGYDSKGSPNIKYYEAFDEDISNIKNFNKLPKGLKELVDDIDNISGACVIGLGVGPHRDQLVMRDGQSLVVNSPRIETISTLEPGIGLEKRGLTVS